MAFVYAQRERLPILALNAYRQRSRSGHCVHRSLNSSSIMAVNVPPISCS